MKETGNKLKSARLAQNISLEEVAQATKIKMQTIIALEEGDLDKLPKKAFIRGFVRTYGGFLKLNVNDLLDSFHREMGSTQKHSLLQSNDSLSDDPAVQIANSKRNPFTRSVFAIAIAIILIVIYMTSRVIQKYQDEKLISEENLQVEPIPTSTPTTSDLNSETLNTTDSSETTEQINGTTANTTVPQTTSALPSPSPSGILASPSPVVTASPSPAIVATPTPIPKPTITPSPSPSPKPTINPSPSPTPKPTASPSPTPKPTATPSPSPKPTASPSPTPKTSPTPTVAPTLSLRPQEIIIESLDKVEIQFSTDGEKWVKIKLDPEQLYTIKAKNNIQFRSSDGGAINLIYNGRDQGVPGTLGEKLELKFPK